MTQGKPRRPGASQRSVGDMNAAPRPMKAVKSVGRSAHRVYCPACGAKKKDGECPRGHPA